MGNLYDMLISQLSVSVEQHPFWNKIPLKIWTAKLDFFVMTILNRILWNLSHLNLYTFHIVPCRHWVCRRLKIRLRRCICLNFLDYTLIDFTLDEHELNLLKTNLRKSWVFRNLSKYCSGVKDDIIRIYLLTSLLRSFFVGACANNELMRAFRPKKTVRIIIKL